MTMEAVVLAGGFGTRLREVLPDLPKPMAPIAGTPFLEILLRMLSNKGFNHVVLSLGYKSEIIIAYFGHRFADLEISYAVEHAPLGTGGAVRLSMSKCKSDHAFIFNGDTYLDLEVTQVEEVWQSKRSPIIVACDVPDSVRYGRLLIDDGRVIGFAEKGFGGQGFINAGCYVLGINALDSWPLHTPFSLETDYFASAVTNNYVSSFASRGKFIDIGVPDDYLRAQSLLAVTDD